MNVGLFLALVRRDADISATLTVTGKTGHTSLVSPIKREIHISRKSCGFLSVVAFHIPSDNGS